MPANNCINRQDCPLMHCTPQQWARPKNSSVCGLQWSFFRYPGTHLWVSDGSCLLLSWLESLSWIYIRPWTVNVTLTHIALGLWDRYFLTQWYVGSNSAALYTDCGMTSLLSGIEMISLCWQSRHICLQYYHLCWWWAVEIVSDKERIPGWLQAEARTQGVWNWTNRFAFHPWSQPCLAW